MARGGVVKLVAMVALVVGAGTSRAEAAGAGVAVLAGSSAAHMVRVEVRSPAWATCTLDDDGGGCALPKSIVMNTRPELELRVPLPRNFEIETHIWTMTHDALRLHLQQIIVGPTLRVRDQGAWLEIGVGVAERAHEVGEDRENAGARLGAALMAGGAVRLLANAHASVELRLKGGMGVGEGGEGVFHSTAALAFRWR